MRMLPPFPLLALFLVAPQAGAQARDIMKEYEAQKAAWIANKCRATVAAAVAMSKPARVEGFLIAVNFDALVNDRFQRVAAAERKETKGGSIGVDMAKYEHHPVYAALPGDSFAKKAWSLLTDKGFSYVEIRMTPDRSGKGYDNGGNLNTSGWSGNRFRLYSLARADDRRCIPVANEFASPSATVALGGFYENLAKQQRPAIDLSKPCLALEITNKPLSRYRIEAEEADETLSGTVRVRDVPMPVAFGVRAERIRVIAEDGSEVSSYYGFNQPDEREPQHRCNNLKAAGNMVEAALMPDRSRAFYRGREWYAGSAVQRFYEPDKAAASPPLSQAAAPLADGACPLRPRQEKGAAVVDQLEDYSGRHAGPSPQSTIGGTQPAAFFSLGRNVTVSKLAWSGGMTGGTGQEKFTVRIFRDANGLPGGMVRELQIAPRARPGGMHGGGSIYESSPQNLSLAAGDYWISILSSPGFFWATEPAGDRPQCGSGGAIRHYDTGSWQEGGTFNPAGYGTGSLVAPKDIVSKPLINHRTARGFSFRMEAR